MNSTCSRPGAGVYRGYGLWGARRRTRLCAGAGVLRAGRRQPPSFPSAVRIMDVLYRAREIADGAGAGRTALPTGRACDHVRHCSWKPMMRSGAPCSSSAISPARTHFERSLARYHPAQTAPWPSTMARRQGWVLAYTAVALWYLGYPEQALHALPRQWPWPRNWPIPLVSRLPSAMRPASMSAAGRGRPPSSGQPLW